VTSATRRPLGLPSPAETAGKNAAKTEANPKRNQNTGRISVPRPFHGMASSPAMILAALRAAAVIGPSDEPVILKMIFTPIAPGIFVRCRHEFHQINLFSVLGASFDNSLHILNKRAAKKTRRASTGTPSHPKPGF